MWQTASDCVGSNPTCLRLYYIIIMYHFVIVDNNEHHILSSKEAKEYIENREWILLKNWYTYLGMSPNPYSFRNCLRNNISYVFDTRRNTNKILLVFRKNIHEDDIVIRVYPIHKKWFRM